MKLIQPKGYVCYRAKQPPRIDGRLDDECWNDAPWTDAFVDIEGTAKPRPRFRTRVKLLWDKDCLYIGAELEEPHVWGTLTAHDAVIFQDNDFELFIDPDGDNHEYYELEVNALNTTWDLLLDKPYKDGGKADNSWEFAGMKTAVHVDGTLNNPGDIDRGWSVEIAIPWTSLAKHAHRPTPPADGDQWRMDFSRVEWQTEIKEGRYRKLPNVAENNWVWSPPGIIDMHRPERWGYIQFSTARPGEAKFQPDPTLPARDLLMEIYHRQKSYQARERKWTDSFDQLGMKPDAWKSLAKPPNLRLTDEGFAATLESPAANGKTQLLHVRQDSRLWIGRRKSRAFGCLREVQLRRICTGWNCPSKHRFAGDAKPLLKHRRIHLPEIGVVLELVHQEVAQAWMRADDAGRTRPPTKNIGAAEPWSVPWLWFSFARRPNSEKCHQQHAVAMAAGRHVFEKCRRSRPTVRAADWHGSPIGSRACRSR